MFEWLRRLMGGGIAPREPEVGEPLRFASPPERRPSPARLVAPAAPSARIIDRYVYASRNGREDHTARGVEYLGIVERPSDGFTCLAVRMPGSTKRHLMEVAQVVEVEIAGRVHRPTPLHERYAETAEKLRAFIEG